MSQNTLPFLDKSVQETNIWLKAIGEELGHPDKKLAYHALRDVLHALRDRIPVNEAFDLAAQMPALIRGIYFESYKPAGAPRRYSKEEFVSLVFDELALAGGENPVHAIRAVFKVMCDKMDSGEMDQIRHVLPAEFQDLWPERVV